MREKREWVRKRERARENEKDCVSEWESDKNERDSRYDGRDERRGKRRQIISFAIDEKNKKGNGSSTFSET